MRLLFAGYIKTGVNKFFDNNKGSKKSNGENTIKFMTFLKLCNVIVNNFSPLVTGYRRQVTEFHHRLKIIQVESRHCLA